MFLYLFRYNRENFSSLIDENTIYTKEHPNAKN